MSKDNQTAAETAPIHEDNAGRDARGRWAVGYCPNSNGRPRKKKSPTYDPSDIQHFANGQVELMVNGEPQRLDRKAALLGKIFESAMKGRVTQQRYLMCLFEKKEDELSELRQQYTMFMSEWVIDNPDFKSFDESLSLQQRTILLGMGTALNHHYPGQFTAFPDIDEPPGGVDRNTNSSRWNKIP